MSSQVQRQAKLTARVHTYASSEGGILANAYLIETSEGVVAIDATLTVSDANNLRGLLGSLKGRLLAVLITHVGSRHRLLLDRTYSAPFECNQRAICINCLPVHRTGKRVAQPMS
jgi:hypothetical protein